MSSSRTGKLERLMLALQCVSAACAAAFFLFVETLVGWFLFFSPGWANGWPFGIRFQTVLTIGTTGYSLLMLVTAAVSVGAIVGLICTVLRIRWQHLGRGYRPWLWFASIFLCVSVVIFWLVYLSVWENFPDGYIIT